jgi:hypothetical protein
MPGFVIGPSGVAPPPSAITTVFANNTLSGDNTIGPSVSVRIGVGVGFASGPLGKVRVTIKAGASSAVNVQGLDCDHLSIGVSTGTLPDTVATPKELTGFNGVPLSSGCSLHTPNATATSDWVNLSFLSTDTLVIIFDQGTASNFDAAQNGGASVGSFAAVWYHLATSASYLTASTGGTFTNAGTFGYAIVSVETE